MNNTLQEIESKVMESYAEKIAGCLIEKGWKIHPPSKIRGMRPDFIMERNGELAAIEVKGKRGYIENGIKQALHFKNAVNYSYLAIPEEAVTDKILNICKNLGIGLIGIGEESDEIVRPEPTKALESVRNRVLQLRSSKPKVRRKGLLQTMFRSKTFVYLLNHLFLNQTKEYYLNELAYETGISAATIARELDKIEPLDIVTRIKKGRTSYYKINQDCIIHEELKRIFLKFELADSIIADELKRFDIKYALIYGSFARGTETEKSDMDLLIVGNADKTVLLRAISKLEGRIGREINYILWNESEFKEKTRQNISLLENIKENELVMIRGGEDEFRQIITHR